MTFIKEINPAKIQLLTSNNICIMFNLWYRSYLSLSRFEGFLAMHKTSWADDYGNVLVCLSKMIKQAPKVGLAVKG